MKALIYEGAHKLAWGEAQTPAPRDGEVLVKVGAVGICGSDMHGYHGTDPRRVPPLILGHEAAGVIEGGPRDGTRVTINPLVPCGDCAGCRANRVNICANRQLLSIPPREGAFAEYLAIPEDNLVEVPAEVPLAKAALAEPLAVAWHASKLGLSALHPEMDRRALVLGGGAIGLASSLTLKAMGIADITIVEPNAERAAFVAERCGETVVSEAKGHWPLVMDAVGYDVTRKTSTDVVEPGGVVVHIGLGGGEGGLDIRRMTLQEITFIGSYCYTPEDFRQTAEAIYDGRLGPLDWIETRPLSEGAKAFQDLDDAKVASPKVVLEP